MGSLIAFWSYLHWVRLPTPIFLYDEIPRLNGDKMKTEQEIKDRLDILEGNQYKRGFGFFKATRKVQRTLQIQVLKWVLEIE